MLLHEWSYPTEQRPQLQTSPIGEISYEKEPTENVTTWVYDEGSYTPIGKLINGERYSIISDYIGRPVQCFNDTGELIWETDYDIYGRLKNLKGDKYFIPFRQMGQYEDEELGGLYYNRFRYYDSWSGVYISQDPIGLHSGQLNFYAYVRDSNSWVDIFGLECGRVGGIKKLWSSTKKLTSVKNAFNHWKKHAGEVPEYMNAKQYVEGSKQFLNNSPAGTLIKNRANGDVMKYHPDTNTFGVMDSLGVPKTMFRPLDGMEYWLKQLK